MPLLHIFSIFQLSPLFVEEWDSNELYNDKIFRRKKSGKRFFFLKKKAV